MISPLLFFICTISLAVALIPDVQRLRLQQKALLASLRNRRIDQSTMKMSDKEIVDYVNQKQNFWKAELHPRLSSYDENVRGGLMGVEYIKLPIYAQKKLSETRNLNLSIPEAFDSREWWAECTPKISKIRDQSSCGSCWAMGAAEAFSDRLCIASRGKLQVDVSAGDLLSCCTKCGNGCQGGFPIRAWEYFVDTGIVTGSDFKTSGCKPYPFPPCHANSTEAGDACKNGMFQTPQCVKECKADYDKDYVNDKFYALSAYGIEDDQEAIQKEIMTYGPVEVAFRVHVDFLSYKKGVYMRTAGPIIGGHAVKLLGWGNEEGVPYWLCANSWGPDWGDHGYFKIVRGIDEVGIESGVVAGIPKIL